MYRWADIIRTQECVFKKRRTSIKPSNSSTPVGSSSQTSDRKAWIFSLWFSNSLTKFPDIIDGNLKLILGMIWTLVLRFTIADIKYDVSLESVVFCDKYADRIRSLK